MDEWVVDGKVADIKFPLSFARTDMELCFNHIRDDLRMPLENIYFPVANQEEYIKSWNKARCVIMQGGQGEVKHWAFNDPPRREGQYKDNPPLPEDHCKLGTRIVDPNDNDPECTHFRWWRGAERAASGGHSRPFRNVEG